MNMTAPRTATAASTIDAPKTDATFSSGAADGEPEQTAGVGESGHPMVAVERRATAEEVTEPGERDEHDDAAGDGAQVFAFELFVAAAADQQRATADQRGRHEDAEHTDDDARRVVDELTQRATEAEVDARPETSPTTRKTMPQTSWPRPSKAASTARVTSGG